MWEQKILKTLVEPHAVEILEGTSYDINYLSKTISFCSPLPNDVYQDVLELISLGKFYQEAVILSLAAEPLDKNSFIEWKVNYHKKTEAEFPYTSCFLVPQKLHFFMDNLTILTCKLLVHNHLYKKLYFYFGIDSNQHTIKHLAPEQFSAEVFFKNAYVKHKSPLPNYASTTTLPLKKLKSVKITYEKPDLTDNISLDYIENDSQKEDEKKKCTIM